MKMDALTIHWSIYCSDIATSFFGWYLIKNTDMVWWIKGICIFQDFYFSMEEKKKKIVVELEKATSLPRPCVPFNDVLTTTKQWIVLY